MRKKRLWRAHYTGRWAVDPFVRGLPLEARMVYFELLDIAWDEGGLHDEWVRTGFYVAKRIGCGRAKFRTIWGKISHKFEPISPGIWSNSRLESERKRIENHEKTDPFPSENHSRTDRKFALTQRDHYAPGAKQRGILDLEKEIDLEVDQKKQKPPDLFERPTEEKGVERFDFAAVYARYPRKEGKAAGMAKLKAAIRTQGDYERLCRAVDNYAGKIAAERTEARYVLHWSTFANGRWEDYADGAQATTATRGVAPVSKFTHRGIRDATDDV